MLVACEMDGLPTSVGVWYISVVFVNCLMCIHSLILPPFQIIVRDFKLFTFFYSFFTLNLTIRRTK